jgi:hypothetical protein
MCFGRAYPRLERELNANGKGFVEAFNSLCAYFMRFFSHFCLKTRMKTVLSICR